MKLYHRISELDQERQNAVRKSKRTVVVARPGSGKTYTLVLKIAYLLGQTLQAPEAVACVTFMNDAVSEIEERLGEYGFESDPRLFVGTVHKFCYSAILLPFHEVFLKDLPLAIADESLQQELLSLSAEICEFPLQNWEINEKLLEIQRARVEPLISNRPIKVEVAQLADTYVELLRERQLIDFTDISIESCKLVINYPIVRAHIRARFPWLIIDEYQDLGAVFNQIVKVLINETDINFFVVGDPNQSIMGFTGAAPAYLREMLKREDVLAINLKVTRRCMPQIARIANKLAPEDEAMDPLSTDIEHRGVQTRYCPEGNSEQLETILSIIQQEREHGTPYGQIAVLCSNRYGIFDDLTSQLSDHKITYSSGKDNRYERTPLTRWLENLARWSLQGWGNNEPRFNRLWHQYRRFLYENNSYNTKNELALLERFFHFLWSNRSSEMLVRDWLNELGAPEGLGLYSLVEKMNDGERYLAHSFKDLESKVAPKHPLEQMTIADLALSGRSAESIYLSTLHSSKGLEFEVVLIPELEQGRLPLRRIISNEEQIAEARRLLYVGITRARRDVYLLYSGFYQTVSRVYELGPSQFLEELELLS